MFLNKQVTLYVLFVIINGCYIDCDDIPDADYSIFSNYSQRRQMRNAMENYSGVNNIFYGRNWTILLTLANVTDINAFVSYFNGLEYDLQNDHTNFGTKQIELNSKMHKIIRHYYKWTCYTSFNGKNVVTEFPKQYKYVQNILLKFIYKHALHFTMIGVAYGQDMSDVFALICYYFDHQTLWDKLLIGDITQWNITISGLEINQIYINATPNCFKHGYSVAVGHDSAAQFTDFVNYYLNKYYHKSENIHLQIPRWSNFYRVYDNEQYNNQKLLIHSDICQANNAFGDIKNMYHLQRLLNWSRQHIPDCGAEIVKELEIIGRKRFRKG